MRPTHRSHADDDEPLVRIALRRAVRRLRRDAQTAEFGRFLAFQATGAAGDALVAIALAGSLFFSVPETTARTRVALYLLLTVAPFAVVTPFLARVLDRGRGSMRAAMVVAAAGRATLAFLLATRLDSLLLFPLAFGILVLSRAVLVVRGAVLPQLVPPQRTLVHANSTLSKIAALAGMAACVPGLALARWPRTELLVTAAVYAVGVVPALRTPLARARRPRREWIGARAAARSVSVRQALVTVAGMRLLVGFLVLHLAFSLRREDFGSVGLGFLVASAATGGLLGALVAPRLRRTLREEGIVVVALVVAAVAGVGVGLYFSLPTAGALVLAFGVAAGAAKVAFDSIVQRETPEAARGWAFARFESYLQLAWVAGALAPLAVSIPAGPGVLAAGVAAALLAIVYTVGRHKVRSAALP
ncbi:MAG TPA: hypothetical protein VHJ34_12330 [Actinomycetota bacterium]|nr:hypothetical protein [Actinomycetota bacterium]